MRRFDLHRKHPSACLHAVGPDAYSTKTLLLSLSTIAGTKISNPPWVNFQSAGWVSFQSAPTLRRALENKRESLDFKNGDCHKLVTIADGLSQRAMLHAPYFGKRPANSSCVILGT
jgi:hypothetical protein